MRKEFFISNFYFLRVPKLPISIAKALNERVSFNHLEEYLKQQYNDDEFRQAIFLASSDLFKETEKWRLGNSPIKEQLLKTIYRYAIRMSMRPTPYGLFSGISIGTINRDLEDSSIIINKNYGIKHRLDMECLTEISSIVANDPVIKEKLMYSLNTTLYKQGKNYKFYQQRNCNGKRHHFLSVVKADSNVEFIQRLLEKSVSYKTLLEEFLKKGATLLQAEKFIGQLIDNQLIISEIGPNVIGRDFLSTLVDKLTSIDIERRFFYPLQKINTLLTKEKCIVEHANTIKRIVNQIAPGISCKNLIQSDLLIGTARNLLNSKIVETITSQLNELLPLSVSEINEDLESFKKLFVKRYGEREISLLEALDPDTGIGYGTFLLDNRKNDELLSSLQLPFQKTYKENTCPFFQSLILKKYIEALEIGESEINLYDKDVEELEKFRPSKHCLPPTSYAIGNLLYKNEGNLDNDNLRFHLQGWSGSSAITLVSRFGHLSEELFTKMQDIASFEQQAYPNSILAEISYLPEYRSGNILQRPCFRDYEISLLMKPSEESNSISLSDLSLSVKENRIILRSKTLNKEIIPRLTSAHNYVHGINLYRFLADMQYQDCRFSLKWDWGNLQNQPFLPRVCYKQVILSRAKWNISGGVQYKNFPRNEQCALSDFRIKHKLPRTLVLAEGDNELLIDFDSPIAVNIFFDRLSKGSVILYEFLYSEYQSPVKDNKEDRYANEVIIPFQAYRQTYHCITNTQTQDRPTTRSFPPGSDWVYIKIFCGMLQGEQLLIDQVPIIIGRLKTHRLLKKWFFIRYHESGCQIRLRMLVNTSADISRITKTIYEELGPLLSSDLIYNFQFDTYVRELERYTTTCMEVSESLFYADSEFVMEVLRKLPSTIERWYIALYGIQQLLYNAGISFEEKLIFCEQMRQMFFEEFQGDKEFYRQLNQLFRTEKAGIVRFFEEGVVSSKWQLLLEKRQIALNKIFAFLRDRVESRSLPKDKYLSLISSYIHMYINRLFPADQRLYELVVYHFLCKYYRIRKAERVQA